MTATAVPSVVSLSHESSHRDLVEPCAGEYPMPGQPRRRISHDRLAVDSARVIDHSGVTLTERWARLGHATKGEEEFGRHLPDTTPADLATSGTESLLVPRDATE